MYMLSCFSCVQLFATLWTLAGKDPLSMGFSKQECWIGLSYPLPGEFPYSGIEPMLLTSPALAGGFFTTSATWEAHLHVRCSELENKGWKEKRETSLFLY